MNMIKKIKLPNQAIKFLIILLSADLMYILLHMTSKIAGFLDMGATIQDEAFNIYTDLGIAESFQYAKEYWIFILLAWMIFKHKKYFFTGWAIMFIYLLFDDIFSIHERLSSFVLERFGVSSRQTLFAEVRYQDFGEIGISLFFGLLLLFPIAIAYIRGDSKVRTTFHYLIGCLLLLVFFGVITDFIDRLFSEETHKILKEIGILIEDGGEMIAMSIMCWYVYTLTEGANYAEVPDGSSGGGGIQIKQGGAAQINGVHVIGDIQLESNSGALSSTVNQVGGNVRIFQNMSGVTLADNNINGNVQCKQNAPAPSGGSNVVRGNKEDQCAGLRVQLK